MTQRPSEYRMSSVKCGTGDNIYTAENFTIEEDARFLNDIEAQTEIQTTDSDQLQAAKAYLRQDKTVNLVREAVRVQKAKVNRYFEGHLSMGAGMCLANPNLFITPNRNPDTAGWWIGSRGLDRFTAFVIIGEIMPSDQAVPIHRHYQITKNGRMYASVGIHLYGTEIFHAYSSPTVVLGEDQFEIIHPASMPGIDPSIPVGFAIVCLDRIREMTRSMRGNPIPPGSTQVASRRDTFVTTSTPIPVSTDRVVEIPEERK